MRSQNYRLGKTWLDKNKKSPVSEHPSKVNMQRRPKRKSAWQHVRQIFSYLLAKMTLKMALLVIC